VCESVEVMCGECPMWLQLALEVCVCVCVKSVCVCVCVEDAGVWFKGVYLRESGSDA